MKEFRTPSCSTLFGFFLKFFSFIKTNKIIDLSDFFGN